MHSITGGGGGGRAWKEKEKLQQKVYFLHVACKESKNMPLTLIALKSSLSTILEGLFNSPPPPPRPAQKMLNKK